MERKGPGGAAIGAALQAIEAALEAHVWGAASVVGGCAIGANASDLQIVVDAGFVAQSETRSDLRSGNPCQIEFGDLGCLFAAQTPLFIELCALSAPEPADDRLSPKRGQKFSFVCFASPRGADAAVSPMRVLFVTALRAEALAPLAGCNERGVFASGVLSEVDGFQMLWIYARSDSAKVIDRKTLRDFSEVPFVGVTMGKPHPPAFTEPAISSIGNIAVPDEARRDIPAVLPVEAFVELAPFFVEVS